MLDELIPSIEELRTQGAVVLLKWDGERTHERCTVVITHRSTDYMWRTDTDDIASALAEALADYRVKHGT